ncbi:YceI family protein [Gluconacetobacter tumulisoli]|uniref:Polyisoprenoid-binding protein n=1 Tax=Gluconacetobacter tumulisoli TaxID=1286189 RepID=A0A7W4K5H9_9PROT|nr:YceI family protein [Gluconacetobacter tumulisoli]MBB2200612.1 polyisoprenoid-binding protein [Gluconacetobacter tumulisoli]
MFRSFLTTSAAASVLLAVTAGAVSAQAPTQPADVQGGAYQVEPGHTQVGFSLLHLGFSYYSGLFSNVSGSLTLDPKTPSASTLNVTIPIASVQTTSDKLTGELKGEQWFDAARFPNATFTSTKVTPIGKDRATVTGNLTIHGVTRPETLKVRFVGAGVNPLDKKYTVGFEAKATINRSDFGVKMYVPYVSDAVELRIAGAFERQD